MRFSFDTGNFSSRARPSEPLGSGCTSPPSPYLSIDLAMTRVSHLSDSTAAIIGPVALSTYTKAVPSQRLEGHRGAMDLPLVKERLAASSASRWVISCDSAWLMIADAAIITIHLPRGHWWYTEHSVMGTQTSCCITLCCALATHEHLHTLMQQRRL